MSVLHLRVMGAATGCACTTAWLHAARSGLLYRSMGCGQPELVSAPLLRGSSRTTFPGSPLRGSGSRTRICTTAKDRGSTPTSCGSMPSSRPSSGTLHHRVDRGFRTALRGSRTGMHAATLQHRSRTAARWIRFALPQRGCGVKDLLCSTASSRGLFGPVLQHRAEARQGRGRQRRRGGDSETTTGGFRHDPPLGDRPQPAAKAHGTTASHRGTPYSTAASAAATSLIVPPPAAGGRSRKNHRGLPRLLHAEWNTA